jgi:hypothetical protein
MNSKISLLIVVTSFIAFSVPLAASQISLSHTNGTMTCYDYSVEYAKNHPGWGCVTMSTNSLFKGSSHIVNYQLLKDNGLHIHDETNGSDYIIYGWEHSGYWHFWINEKPVRSYRFLQDNSQMAIRTL